MKKIVPLMLVTLLVACLLTACGSKPTSPEDHPRTAEGLLQTFKDAGLPVINEVSYTSETDPNAQLGRPGCYIAKTNFDDNRFYNDADQHSIAIEVFENKTDMEKRRDYIQSLTDSSSVGWLQYYIYDKGVFLFRIPYAATPDQAKEYEAVFNEYVDNGKTTIKYDNLTPTKVADPASINAQVDLGSAVAEQVMLSTKKNSYTVGRDVEAGRYSVTSDVPVTFSVMGADYTTRYNDNIDGQDASTGSYPKDLEIELFDEDHIYPLSAGIDGIITLTPIP